MSGDRGVRGALIAGIRMKAFPGGAWAYGTPEKFECGAEGTICSHVQEPVGVDSLWDLASLTKVLSGTLLAMHLWEQGKLDLEEPVVNRLPSFAPEGKGKITVRNLLLHNSGLPAFVEFHTMGTFDPEVIVNEVDRIRLQSAPGEASDYSCLGFITLTRYLQTITGMSHADACQKLIYDPMGLANIGFNPSDDLQDRCPPTEAAPEWRIARCGGKGLWSSESGRRFIRGSVHDETCFLLGGAAGNAGLFASIEAVARIGQALLTGAPGVFSLATVRAFARRHSMASSRGLGWDTKALTGDSTAGTKFGQHTFGHLGFTGTSLWVDPEAQKFCALLTNRVHPTRQREGIGVIRPIFADACFDAADAMTA